MQYAYVILHLTCSVIVYESIRQIWERSANEEPQWEPTLCTWLTSILAVLFGPLTILTGIIIIFCTHHQLNRKD